jgi:hypothetical protein
MWCPPSCDLEIEKVSNKPSSFECHRKLRNPIKLDIDRCLTTRILFCKYFTQILSYANLFFTLSTTTCPSHFTQLSLFCNYSSHGTTPSYCMPFRCYWPPSYAKRKYPYISKLILKLLITVILSTGYRLPCERAITFATLKFESFQSCVYFTCSLIQTQILCVLLLTFHN